MAELEQQPPSTPPNDAPREGALSPHKPPRPRPNEPEPETSSSSGATVLLVGLAVAAIVGLYLFARLHVRPNQSELPVASVLVEVERFDEATRAAIAKFQNDLEATQLFDVLGPSSLKYLVPQAKVGQVPYARDFKMPQADWDEASPYFTCGDWLVPRMFRADGRACVIRLAPRNRARAFAPNAGAEIDRVIGNNKDSFKKLVAYSATAGVGGDAERDALNVTFGTTTAWTICYRPATATDPAAVWKSPDGMKMLDGGRAALTPNAHLRSVTTPVSWLKYYLCVKAHLKKDPELPNALRPIEEAFDYARSNGIPSLLSQDGAEALFDASTDLEGKANREVYYYLGSVLQDNMRCKCKGWTPPLEHGATAPEKKD